MVMTRPILGLGQVAVVGAEMHLEGAEAAAAAATPVLGEAAAAAAAVRRIYTKRQLSSEERGWCLPVPFLFATIENPPAG